MSHVHGDAKKLVARVRRIGGQLGSVERAIAEGAECGAVLQQLAAVRGAVNGLIFQMMESHLTAHVGGQAGGMPDEELAPVLAVLRSYMK